MTSYIRAAARGGSGALALTAAQAEDLMGRVLDGGVGDAELGAFALATRIKPATADEIAGFRRAVQARTLRVQSDRPLVVLPSYHGARTLPNLTPLLAMLLAQDGARVLVHGQAHDPLRVTSLAIFQDLGLPAAQSVDDIENAWNRREPAVVPTALLCPPLQRLLDLRRSLELYNAGHTAASMIDPAGGAPRLRVLGCVGPEFARLAAEWVRRESVSAMLLAGTEGEPVADPRQPPRIDTYLAGRLAPEFSASAPDNAPAELTLLPHQVDSSTTALYIQSVLSGEKPAPAPLLRQVQLAQGALAALAGAEAESTRLSA